MPRPGLGLDLVSYEIQGTKFEVEWAQGGDGRSKARWRVTDRKEKGQLKERSKSQVKLQKERTAGKAATESKLM